MESSHFTPDANELRRLIYFDNASLTRLLSINPSLAFRTVRAVLHTVRRQFDVEHSLRFLDQLPLSLKSLYIDHWDPQAQEETHPRSSLEELVDDVEENYPYLMRDIQHDRQLVREIFITVSKIVDYPIGVPMSESRNFINQESTTKNRQLPQDQEPNYKESSIWLP